jgi:hypothetical protein
VRRGRPTPQLVVVPVGAGEAKVLPTGSFEIIDGGGFVGSASRVLFGGTEPGHESRLYVMDVAGGPPRPVTAEGVTLVEWPARWVSPDGKWAFAAQSGKGVFLFPLEGPPGSPPVSIAGLGPGDALLGWTADSRSLFVQGPEENPAPVYRLDWKSGRRELFREYRPVDPNGLAVNLALVAPDGSASVYSYVRRQSELYLVEGLR